MFINKYMHTLSSSTIICISIIFMLVTWNIYLQVKLNKLKHYNTLTNLPKKSMFLNYLTNSVLNNNIKVALFIMDLDNYRSINSNLGYIFGDKLMRTIGDLLRKNLCMHCNVYHFSSDKFYITMEYKKSKEIIDTATKILNIFREPIKCLNKDIFITSSIGISTYPLATNIQSLVAQADTALYYAKIKKNTYKIFNLTMKSNIKEFENLILDIRSAIKNNEFVVFYQPQVDINTERIVSAEALVRWNHPVKGFLSPQDFLPVADKAGLLNPILNLVINTVCKDIRSWIAQDFTPVIIAINFSAYQVDQNSINFFKNESVKIVKDFKKNLLEIEITETDLIESYELMCPILNDLKSSNINICLDDFGTGYSSFERLKNLPIDTLKIDKCFIDDILSDKKSRVIVGSLINMAKDMGLKLIAEGVENEKQLSILKKQGCTIIQGYYYSKPVNKDVFGNMLKNKYIPLSTKSPSEL